MTKCMDKLWLVLVAGLVGLVFTGKSDEDTRSDLPFQEIPAWEKIAQYFTPPTEFADKYGEYMSPLNFYNGTPVKSPAEWQQRRQEILQRWHGIMGEWPPLLKDQELQIEPGERKENYMQHRVEFNWFPNGEERTHGYLLIPDGEGPRPAVIVVFYTPEWLIGIGGKPYNDLALQFARQGFVTLAIATSGSQGPTSLYYPTVEDATVQPLSMLAYGAANAWYALSKVNEVDAKRIAVAGHSYGSKWAMFASTLFEGFACGVWSDGGIVFDDSLSNVNYHDVWYLGYHKRPWRERGRVTPENPARGAYKTLRDQGLDMTDLHALMAPRPFLVSGGAVEPLTRWMALNHSIKVNKFLGAENRVAMTNRPKHSNNPESIGQMVDFLKYFLMGEGTNQLWRMGNTLYKPEL